VELANTRVLIVDDDQDIRETLELLLVTEGYDVKTARHGLEALEVLRGWLPSLIVLDLMMPELDGWGFRARQVSHELWATIPVIVLSATHELQRQAEVLGAAAVVQKPFDLDGLLGTIGQLSNPIAC
jgi:CheY-like chemotaxis protein